MIVKIRYTEPAPSSAVAVEMVSGQIWYDDAALPADTELRQAVAGWLITGNVIAPYEEPQVPVPERISRRQFFMQLEISGLSGQVTNWVSGQPVLTQIAFNESSTFERADPMLQAGFQALNFHTEEVDDFFRAAALL